MSEIVDALAADAVKIFVSACAKEVLKALPKLGKA